MDNDEKIVLELLYNKNFEEVIFEPDGNIPPDFRIGKYLAVDVRRLNQNFLQKDEVAGLEQLSIPLLSAFREVLKSFGKQKSNLSFFVGIFFKRPFLLSIYDFKKLLKKNLLIFLDSPDQIFPYSLTITSKVDLLIQKTPSTNKDLFRPMGSMDSDSGGFITSMYIKNIRYCIDEKSEKIKGHLHRYDEWWLYLVDRMLWDLDISEKDEIAKNIRDLGNFDKVSVIQNGVIYLTLD